MKGPILKNDFLKFFYSSNKKQIRENTCSKKSVLCWSIGRLTKSFKIIFVFSNFHVERLQKQCKKGPLGSAHFSNTAPQIPKGPTPTPKSEPQRVHSDFWRGPRGQSLPATLYYNCTLWHDASRRDDLPTKALHKTLTSGTNLALYGTTTLQPPHFSCNRGLQ